MAKDVIITPLDGDIQFKNSSGNDSGKIEQSGDDLVLTNAVGDVLIGDGASDVFVGDGTNSVDIIFEQPGSIKGLDGSSVDLTIGSYDTDLTISGSTLNLQTGGGNVGIGTTTADYKLDVNGEVLFRDGNIRSNNTLDFLTTGGAAQTGQFKSLRLSTTYSGGTIPDNGILFYNDTNLYRSAANTLKTDDSFEVDGRLYADAAVTLTQAASDQNTAQDSGTIPSTTISELIKFQGGYTNGQYTTELVKVDRSGNLPLYFRQSKGTANSFTNLIRIGDHGQTNGTDIFAVFGNARVDGTLTVANVTATSVIYTDEIRDRTGQDLTITAGEASGHLTQGTHNDEVIRIAAESGVKVYSSTDNLTSGLNKVTTLIDSSGHMSIAGDLTVGGGDISLSGTGRIQGVDTVTDNTDAANKQYVDDSVTGLTEYVAVAGDTMTGTLTSTQNGGDASIYINSTRPTLGFTDSNSFSDANDIYIIRGTSSDKLQFQWYDDSAGTTTETFNIDSSGLATFQGRVGVGTGPVSGYALAISGSMTFGVPAGGSVNYARYASIEGNTDGSGEGSGRIFFTEHNSTTAAQNKYGMSLGYRGGLAAITTANGESWGGLSAIGNGQWGMWGHDNSLNGALVMYGDRAATYVDFAGNNIQGITDIYVDDQIISTGDTNTYMQFHAADQWRVVTGGGERIEANNTEVRIANNLVIGGSELDLPSGGMIDWANGDARIVEGETNNYSLSFKTYDGSAVTTALRLDGDNSALFSGSVTIDTSGSTVFDIQGSQGQLFSVTDDLSGDLFTVSDISGVPILNVNASATSSFDGYLGIGTTTPTQELDVNGDIVIKSGGVFRIRRNTTDNPILWQDNSNDKLYLRQPNNNELHLQTNGNNSRLVINGSGLVGIGTSGMHGKLTVHGGHIRIDSSGGTDNYYLEMYEAGAQRFRIYENSNNVYFDGGPGATTFRPRQGGGSNNFQVSGASIMLTTSGQVVGNTGEVLYLYAGGTSGAGLEINEPANSIYLKSIDGIYPETDNTSEIGSSTYTFANGRFTNFTVDSVLNVRNYIDLADSDGIRFGSGDDFRMFYDGSNNELEMEMESACNRIRVTDNTTTRFSLEKGGTFQATAGFTTDGNAKSYTWRAIENTASTSNQYYRIATITGGQSTRFSIELVGRSTSYGDGVFTAWGKLIGQLNNDNNYDLTYYNFKTEDSEVVTEIAQVDVSTSATDIYVRLGQFSEIAAFGLISDGSITPYDTNNGSTSTPTGYTQAARSYTMHHNKIGNIDGTNFRDSDNTSYSLTPSSGATGYWQVNTPSGYIQLGPQNTSWSHFQTDRGGMYFNKKIIVDTGTIGSYDEDLSLVRANSTADRILIRSTSIGFFLDSAEDMRLENDGDLHVEGDVIAYSTTISDSRLKDDIITIGGALDKVKKLRGVEYTWNKGSRKDQKDLGVIAQEVEEVVPEIVREKKMSLMDDSGTKYKTVDYEKLTALLIEGMKEQQQQIDDLKAIVNKLQNEK